MNKFWATSIAFLLLSSTPGSSQDYDIRSLKIGTEKSINQFVKNGFSGSVLVAISDSIILNGGFGFTDSTNRYEITPATLFNIASITKTFTALAVLKLSEKGLLQLTDRIGKYFPNVPADKESITVHQLLTHTSGFQQHYVAMEVSSRDTAISKYLGDTLKFKPGSGFQYSNENFELLAALVETVSNHSYEEYIRSEILIPCGLKNTHFWGEIDDLDAQKVAQKLRDLSSKTRKRNWDYLGSGGIYSTSSDLYKLYVAVKANKILKPETTQLLFRSYKKLGSGDVGYGWFINDTEWKTKEYWTRGTEDWGHNAILRWFPEEKVVVIVCSNAGEKLGLTTANRIVSDKLLKILFSDKVHK